MSTLEWQKPVAVAAAGMVAAALLATAVVRFRPAKPADEPKPATPKPPVEPRNHLATFLRVMGEYDVPKDNAIESGKTDYLDRPVKGRLFTGQDNHGRAFVNLPILLKHYTLDGGKEWLSHTESEAFVVFQRYTDNQRVFVIGAPPRYITRENFLIGYDGVTTFSNLRRLLAGEVLKFHGPSYNSDGPPVNPNAWVTIELEKPAQAAAV